MPASASPVIEFGVLGPPGLVDLRGLGCELVPEAVELDAFASRDEPLGIRSAAGEMPEQGMAHEVVPGGMPGTGASITTGGWVSRDHVPSGWNTDRAEPNADTMGGP
jgi:hypothetical protein